MPASLSQGQAWGRLRLQEPPQGDRYPKSVPHVIHLVEDCVEIGRTKAAHEKPGTAKVAIPLPYISGRHCEICREHVDEDGSASFIVKDHSSNGTYIGSNKAIGKGSSQPIVSGQELSIFRRTAKSKSDALELVYRFHALDGAGAGTQSPTAEPWAERNGGRQVPLSDPHTKQALLDAQAQVITLQEQNNKLVNEVKVARKSSTETGKRLKSATSQVDEQIKENRELKGKVAAHEQEQKQLEQTLRREHVAALDGLVKQHEKAVETLEQEKKELRLQQAELARKLEEAKSSSDEIMEREEIVKTLQQEKGDLQHKVASALAQASLIRGEKQELTHKLQKAQEEEGKLAALLVDSRACEKDLQERLGAVEENLRAMKQAKAETEGRLQAQEFQLHGSTEQLSEKLAKAQEECEALREESSKRAVQVTSLEEKCQALEKDRDESKGAVSELVGSNERLEEELRLCQARNEKLEHSLSLLTAKVEKTQEQAMLEEGKYVQDKAKQLDVELRLQEMQNIINQYEGDLSTAKDENRMMRMRMSLALEQLRAMEKERENKARALEDLLESDGSKWGGQSQPSFIVMGNEREDALVGGTQQQDLVGSENGRAEEDAGEQDQGTAQLPAVTEGISGGEEDGDGDGDDHGEEQAGAPNNTTVLSVPQLQLHRPLDLSPEKAAADAAASMKEPTAGSSGGEEGVQAADVNKRAHSDSEEDATGSPKRARFATECPPEAETNAEVPEDEGKEEEEEVVEVEDEETSANIHDEETIASGPEGAGREGEGGDDDDDDDDERDRAASERPRLPGFGGCTTSSIA